MQPDYTIESAAQSDDAIAYGIARYLANRAANTEESAGLRAYHLDAARRAQETAAHGAAITRRLLGLEG